MGASLAPPAYLLLLGSPHLKLSGHGVSEPGGRWLWARSQGSCPPRGWVGRGGAGREVAGWWGLGALLPRPTWVGSLLPGGHGGLCWLGGAQITCRPRPASFVRAAAGPKLPAGGVVAALPGVGLTSCSVLARLPERFCFSSELTQERFSSGLGSLTDKAGPFPSGHVAGFSARS